MIFATRRRRCLIGYERPSWTVARWVCPAPVQDRVDALLRFTRLIVFAGLVGNDLSGRLLLDLSAGLVGNVRLSRLQYDFFARLVENVGMTPAPSPKET
jgi:hypothetical protein